MAAQQNAAAAAAASKAKATPPVTLAFSPPVTPKTLSADANPAAAAAAAPAAAAADVKAAPKADAKDSKTAAAAGAGDGTSFPKNKIKALLLEGISQTAIDMLVKEGYQVETVYKITESELIAKLPNFHLLGIRSKTQVTAKVLEAAKKLLAIGCFCIGTDQTDLDAAAAKGVCVFNAPFANTRSVAELCLAEMILLARQAGDRNNEMHKKIWNKESKNCFEVRGKTVGIIGYGHVGSQLSVLAEAIGMSVIYFDINTKMPLGNARPANSMDEVLKSADFVTLHVPGEPSTVKLIGAREIALMRKGTYLLNASRGTVVDVDAAAAALKSGHLFGGAFDVFPEEPAGKGEELNSPLTSTPNTFLTPHIGGSTEEAQAAIGREVARKFIDFINTGNTVGSVNMPEMMLHHNPRTHRVLNVHKNVPGVLRNINQVLQHYNVVAQMLMTRGGVGYLIVEVDSAVSKQAKAEIAAIPQNIRTRVLY